MFWVADCVRALLDVLTSVLLIHYVVAGNSERPLPLVSFQSLPLRKLNVMLTAKERCLKEFCTYDRVYIEG